MDKGKNGLQRSRRNLLAVLKVASFMEPWSLLEALKIILLQKIVSKSESLVRDG